MRVSANKKWSGDITSLYKPTLISRVLVLTIELIIIRNIQCSCLQSNDNDVNKHCSMPGRHNSRLKSKFGARWRQFLQVQRFYVNIQLMQSDQRWFWNNDSGAASWCLIHRDLCHDTSSWWQPWWSWVESKYNWWQFAWNYFELLFCLFLAFMRTRKWTESLLMIAPQ